MSKLPVIHRMQAGTVICTVPALHKNGTEVWIEIEHHANQGYMFTLIVNGKKYTNYVAYPTKLRALNAAKKTEY